MSFIHDHERIILFDCVNARGQRHDVAELLRLREAGIETAFIHGLDMGEYLTNPGYIDAHLARLRAASMKVILPLWNKHSRNLPQAWYARNESGGMPKVGDVPEYTISPWSMPGREYFNHTLYRAKYDYEADDVQVVSVMFRDGEMMQPTEPRWGDEACKASHEIARRAGLSDAQWLAQAYIDLMQEQQAILVDSPWREIWFMLQPGKTGRLCNGVDWTPDYIKAWKRLEPSAINHITYSMFPQPTVPAMVQAQQRTWGTLEWAGAEYCQGLQDGNYQRAQALGLRGLMLGPCHPYTGKMHLEPWMIDEVRKVMDA